ncbi:hypothetical protein Phep_3805 [Pedobacter heparinus DSM 2366]|uniref:Uncharacterized protein n=1 Tax=Pedobacter heparinus (strain ATCC 13125 / DSM 2366 / CIP 104194 / JCM 7457 / NBRC 12017 / NCIMB 9290 / NRRL B-14731 / HIM 762-3) TaxID=485917 RepID=C6XUY8_PEDHD|nr:hypothetical protein Phep_3805 [Pedobacter heparinus DSM 2366]
MPVVVVIVVVVKFLYIVLFTLTRRKVKAYFFNSQMIVKINYSIDRFSRISPEGVHNVTISYLYRLICKD